MINIELIEKKSIEVFSQSQVEQAICQLGTTISKDYADLNPICLCVVVGGIYLTGQLMPHITCHMRMNYIHASRYQGGTQGHTLSWKAKPTVDIEGEHILLIDDVLDEGITLAQIKAYCLDQGAVSVKSVVLIDKQPCRHPEGLKRAEYTGLYTGDQYLYGCGLDCHELLRNVPAIHAIPADVLQNLQQNQTTENIS